MHPSPFFFLCTSRSLRFLAFFSSWDIAAYLALPFPLILLIINVCWLWIGCALSPCGVNSRTYIYIQCFHLSNAINPYDHVYSLATSIVVVCQIVKWNARTVCFHEILFSDFAGNTRFIVLLTNAISVWLCSETQVVDQKEPWSKLTVVVSQIMMWSISPCQELQM